MSKKILITGGVHPIGLALARMLLKKDYYVTLFDSHSSVPKDVKTKVRFIKGDITDQIAVAHAVKGHDIIVHTAEITELYTSKKNMEKVNVDGTEYLLKASLASKSERFIFLSTTAVYGIPKELPLTEESALNPPDAYSITKVMAERQCKHYQDQGLSLTILRPRPVIGPSFVGSFTVWFEALYNGRRLLSLGNGKNKYQLLSLSDLCEGIYKAIISPTTNTVYNLGAKEYSSLRRDVQTLIRFDKAPSRITGLPPRLIIPLLTLLRTMNLSPFARRHYLTLARPCYVSLTKAEKELSWSPKKSNKELLLESYLWYKKNRKKILKHQDSMEHTKWNFSLYELLSRF